MSVQQGYNGSVAVGGTDGSGGTEVSYVSDVSVTSGRQELDITGLGREAVEILPGLKEFSGSVSGTYDSTDTGQAALRDNVKLDTTTNIAVLYDGTNGVEADVHVTSFDLSAAPDGTTEYTASFTGSDADGFNWV